MDGTVRRATGPWTPAVHGLLRHLEEQGFDGAPRVRGFDDRGREVLTYLDGETCGDGKPPWIRTDSALEQTGRWLRAYHQVVAGYRPPDGAVWREGGAWRDGLIVGHNDAGPYNAVWQGDRLTGFVDWDFAGPCEPVWDLAFAAYSWVPLPEPGGRRLGLLLDAYGWQGTMREVLEVVRVRVTAHVRGIRERAAAGEPAFIALLGAADDMERTL